MPDIPIPDGPGGPYDPQDGWWERRKGPVIFVVACGLILFTLWWLDVFGKPDPPQPQRPAYMLVKAGTVDPLASTPGKVIGHFVVSADGRSDPQTDRSFGSGGACLIADLGSYVGGDQSCTIHKDCSDKWAAYYDTIKDDSKFTEGTPATPTTPATPGFTKEGAGYCVSKRCWYRPYGGSCQRRAWEKDGVYYGPWPTGTHDIELADTGFLKKMYGQNANLNWQVIACANRASTSAPWKDEASCPASAGIYDPPQE